MASRDTSSTRPATRAVHAGSPPRKAGEPVVPPVVQSATFHYSRPDEGHELLYSRYGNNPNQRAVAEKVAALEGMEDAHVLASGMAAISMSLLSIVESGDHIVASRHLYGATSALLRVELPRRGITTTFVDPEEDGAWSKAATGRTRAFLVELPTNPTLRVFDMEPPRRAASDVGAVLMADVTFASPANLRGADHGIDLVIHSATKYLGGHSDLIAGVVSGSAARIEAVREVARLYGPALDPHAAWLLERGIRTLPLRMERHNDNALQLARWLVDQEGVDQVIYPGLPNHPDHARAREILAGFGGMLSLVLAGGGDAADRFMAALGVAIAAPSLGGVETLVSQPRYTSHLGLTPDERAAQGIPDGFVRVSVGLEDVEDLQEDFRQSLRAARG